MQRCEERDVVEGEVEEEEEGIVDYNACYQLKCHFATRGRREG